MADLKLRTTTTPDNRKLAEFLNDVFDLVISFKDVGSSQWNPDILKCWQSPFHNLPSTDCPSLQQKCVCTVLTQSDSSEHRLPAIRVRSGLHGCDKAGMSDRGGPASRPGQSLRDLWSTERHWHCPPPRVQQTKGPSSAEFQILESHPLVSLPAQSLKQITRNSVPLLVIC